MGDVLGDNIKLTIFGESHGKGVGIVIDGIPSGIRLDLEYINFQMQRRAPGKSKLVTGRKEKDNFEIISGFFNGRTTGTPLASMIWNKDKRSKDYEEIKNIMRPGHADYTGHIKYSGFNDYRGGGHFSGRLTAPLVFAGAIARQILKNKLNICFGSHICSIGDIEGEKFDDVSISEDLLTDLSQIELPVIDIDKRREMEELILEAKSNRDSVGGIVETAILNLPSGIGAPFFMSIESKIAQMIFSIPGIKGIEFGKGFDITKLSGSQSNDSFYFDKDTVKTHTNNNGGILGGITNGMPVIFRVAIKPTPSIGKRQKTINIEDKKEVFLEIEGRHDPCIVPRVVPVVEAVAALAILDLMIEGEGTKWMI
ncbi:chorismate synthase [Sporosalibacterium faouarense]|uniref:chorismate synthase n=1 Tax=Sporosalibacterium faouarense TaxID=516123 RepID=UPI00141D0592|nr:chorismate synthase [Sporosalibacterium faouarense]MTI47372.1 chorismate synthase [Bacillota bacterium]